MKIFKSIMLILVYPSIMLGIGFYLGVLCTNYFYPTRQIPNDSNVMKESKMVQYQEETVLSKETIYELKEYDTEGNCLKETTFPLPEKYYGMDREAFIEAMDLYEQNPPLREQEKGFVSLEVDYFTPQKIEISFIYTSINEKQDYYLRLENHYIVVYFADNESVYMYTEILAESLPWYLQEQIIIGMYVEDEEALFNFLETYSS